MIEPDDWPFAQSLPANDGVCSFCGLNLGHGLIGLVDTGERDQAVRDPETGLVHEPAIMAKSCFACAEKRHVPWMTPDEVLAAHNFDEGRLSVEEAWVAAERGDFIPPPEVDLMAAAALGASLRQSLLGLDSDGPMGMPFDDLEQRHRDVMLIKAGIAMAQAGYEMDADEGYAFVSALLHQQWR